MKDYTEVMADISAAVQGIETLKKHAYKSYSALVDEILADRLTDEATIEIGRAHV